MLNPSMPQSAPAVSAPPSLSSTHNLPVHSGGGTQASGAPSFSNVLADEMHGRREEAAAVSAEAAEPGAVPNTASGTAPGTVPYKQAADMATEKMELDAESAVGVPSGAAPSRHSARAGAPANTGRAESEGAATPEEKGDSYLLADILASLGVVQPAPVPVPVAVDAGIAHTRSGESEPPGSHPADAREAAKGGIALGDLLPWTGGYNTASTSGTGNPGAGNPRDTGDPRAPKAGAATLAANAPAAAQAKGKQDVLLDAEENRGKADTSKPDPVQRNDFRLSLPEAGMTRESEKQGKTMVDGGFQSSLPSFSSGPQISFLTQPMEPGFAMTDARGSFPLSAMHDLPMPVGASGWDDALSQKVLWMVSGQEQVAELSLNPPDLGPLQVTLSISNDQAIATFVSQHADVRQALEAALPRLKEMMAESGINLGGATVSSGGDGSYQQGSERQNRSGSRYFSGGSAIAQGNDSGMITGSSGGKSRLVDIFA
jgi:flagellar hook-length control protein FliK